MHTRVRGCVRSVGNRKLERSRVCLARIGRIHFFRLLHPVAWLVPIHSSPCYAMPCRVRFLRFRLLWPTAELGMALWIYGRCPVLCCAGRVLTLPTQRVVRLAIWISVVQMSPLPFENAACLPYDMLRHDMMRTARYSRYVRTFCCADLQCIPPHRYPGSGCGFLCWLVS